MQLNIEGSIILPQYYFQCFWVIHNHQVLQGYIWSATAYSIFALWLSSSHRAIKVYINYKINRKISRLQTMRAQPVIVLQDTISYVCGYLNIRVYFVECPLNRTFIGLHTSNGDCRHLQQGGSLAISSTELVIGSYNIHWMDFRWNYWGNMKFYHMKVTLHIFKHLINTLTQHSCLLLNSG